MTFPATFVPDDAPASFEPDVPDSFIEDPPFESVATQPRTTVPNMMDVTAVAPQRSTPIDIASEPTPSFSNALRAILPSDLGPEQSVLGITPEEVPSGANISETLGLPKIITTPASAIAKTAAGLGQFFTSPSGGAQTVTAAVPGIGLAQKAHWVYDMAKGAGEATGDLAARLEKLAKTPEAVTQDDWQAVAEDSANAIAMLYGAGKLTSHQVQQATGVRAPLGRMTEPARKRFAKDLAFELNKQQPASVPVDAAARENLGLPPRTPAEAMLPELRRTKELVDRAIQEAQSKIIVPGQTPALELLRAQGIEIFPESRATAERVQGGGEAPYGKVSYMREAEAPTTARTQVATEGERATLQKLVDEESSKGAVYDPAVLPNGITYRRPKTAPTQAEYQKQLAKESVEQGLSQESGYYLDEPRTQSLPEIEPQPQRLREGVTIIYPGTGRAIEKPIPLSALQRSRLRVALSKGAPEETILNILRLRAPENPQATQKSSVNAQPTKETAPPPEPSLETPATGVKPITAPKPSEFTPDQIARQDAARLETEANMRKELGIEETQSLTDKLAALKFKSGKDGRVIPDQPGQTFSLPHPDAIKLIGKQLWNDSIDVAIAVIKAGKAAGEAVDAAIAHIRKNGTLKVKTGFDEAQTRANLLSALGEINPVTKPTPTATAPVPPVPGVKPTKVVTPKEARQMDRSVKLDKDVSKIKEQLDVFDQNIGEALTEGGQFLPKEMRPDVAKGKPAETKTVTSKEINQYFVNQLVTVRKGMQRLRTEMEANADTTSQMFFDALQKRFELSFRKVQELRRASHEALYFWNQIRGEYQEIAKMAGEMPAIKQRKPIIDQIVKDLRDKNFARAGKDFVDYLRVNLFTPFSFTLDFTTNLMAVAGHTPAWLGMDLAHLVTGNPITRTATALRALKLAGRNAIPFAEKFRLPEEIEIGLGTAAGGEFQGLPREVMVDFSEILRGNPKLASKLKNADYVLGGPVRMKRAVDNFFGRFGATAELYNAAYQAGRGKKLKGDELKEFVEEFVKNPPEEAIASAIRVGGEFKFNRQLPQWAERFAANTITKLAVEAYPRWTLQFTKWAGEMLAVDPGFFKKVKDGTATAEQTASYLAKAATGWGALYAFNQLFYNQVDPNTMEFVTEKGERIRLSGRQPFPELYLMAAMFRGDINNAKAALPYTSIPFASMIGGQGGLLSPLVNTMAQSWSGNYTAEQASREMTKMVNNAIPGKSLLGLARSLYDPTVREGIGAPIPGVAGFLPARVNPTTGEPLAPMQRIPGTNIKLPAVGGTPFPGALRIQNQIEKVLMNHGISTVRPRRTSLIEIPTEDVPKELRREYEQRVGANVSIIVGEGIQNPEWQQLDFDNRRDVLNVWLTHARAVAKAELAEKYQKSNISDKPIPMNVRRLPPFVKELSPAR